jgi:hypothetical protein
MREIQKLIDLCFEIALLISDTNYNLYKQPNERKAKWIADQLRGYGFDTTPCGASWGVLNKEKEKEHDKVR